MTLRQQLLVAFLLASSSTTLLAYAQSFSPLSGAPTCAQSCAPLTAAVTTCENAGTAGGVATCFCTQQGTAGLASDGSICSSSCTDAASQAAAQQWFAAYCLAPSTVTGAQAPAGTPASSTPAATSVPPATTTVGTIPASTSTSSSSPGSAPPDNRSWWQIHARWVAMVIVLIVAFAIIIIVGVLWKRRYNRKHNLGDLLPPGTPWGPSRHQQHPSSSGDVNTVVSNAEKGQGPSGVRQPERGQLPRQPSKGPTKGSKLKKLVGR